MKVKAKEFLNVLNKLSDLIDSGVKATYVMLDYDEYKLRVCYNDPTKAFIEEINSSLDEGEQTNKYAVDFFELSKAVTNCMPSGSLIVEELGLSFDSNGLMTVSSQPMMNVSNTDEETVLKGQGKRHYSIKYFDVNSSVKTQLLIRMDYESLFNAESADEWDRTELVDYLSRCSTTKGKQVFMSSKIQQIFVDNQSYLTDIEISPRELTEIEIQSYEQDLKAQGIEGEELAELMKKYMSRMRNSVVLLSNIVKSVCSVLSKSNSEKVYVHNINTFCVFYVDNEDEHLAFWLTMPSPSRVTVKTLMTYREMQYTSYQLRFRYEALADAVRVAVNSTSEKATLSFEADENGEVSLKFICSTGDCEAVSEETVDDNGTLTSKKFVVSPKLFDDMLKVIKTPLVAMDFHCGADGSTAVRLSEIDYDKMLEAYSIARSELSPEEPTPSDKRYWIRERSIKTRQYALISR